MSKPKDALKWVELASIKDIKANAYELERRPSLGKVWAIGDKSLAADGFRMHWIDETLPDAQQPSSHPSINVPDFLALIPRKRESHIIVSNWALTQALTACKPFARDSSKITRWSANGSLDIAATSAEYGDCKVRITNGDTWTVKQGSKSKQMPIEYSHIGPDIEFGLNVKYAIEALSGLGELVTIWYRHEHKPFLFTSGNRGAVCMPIHISR